MKTRFINLSQYTSDSMDSFIYLFIYFFDFTPLGYWWRQVPKCRCLIVVGDTAVFAIGVATASQLAH